MDWLTLDTWITSDQHWSHDNIRKYQGRPDDHFEIMYERWNEVVGRRDTVLNLGDIVCFGDQQTHPGYLKGLKGDKYLLKGNHDKHTDEWYKKAGFTVIGHKPFLWVAPNETIVCFSHEPDRPHNIVPDTLYGAWEINIHGHIHANSYYPDTPTADYRNICVEVTNYAPVRLRDVLAGTDYMV